jgi:hypothetical protein
MNFTANTARASRDQQDHPIHPCESVVKCFYVGQDAKLLPINELRAGQGQSKRVKAILATSSKPISYAIGEFWSSQSGFRGFGRIFAGSGRFFVTCCHVCAT